MLYLLAIGLGIGLGLVFGGKVTYLLSMSFKKIGLIIGAFLMQIVFQAVNARGLITEDQLGIPVYGLIFCLLLLGFWFNRKYRGMVVIGAGCLMNALVILANRGRMPVSEELVRSVVSPDILAALMQDGRHVLAGSGTHLAFLSDIIGLQGIWGMGMRVVSIGDLVVVAGLFLLILELTAGWNRGKDSRGTASGLDQIG